MAELTTIQLTTPALDAIKHPDTLTKPQAVRSWADNLPYANPPRMAQEALSSLKLLNRHPDKVPQRTDIMVIYLDLFSKTMDMVRKVICKNNERQGANKNSHELISLADAICSEMAYGFKHIINSELNAETRTTPTKRAEHIQRAIACLSSGLILNMAAYRPESQTAWREIFQLLTMAQQLGVANQEITNVTEDAGYEVSVLNSFKSILLTSILDPSRLTPREIWGAHDYLSWHAKNSRITSLEQASDYSGNYLIAMDGIKKPTLFNPERVPQLPGKHMILETHGLNINISKHLDILSEDRTALVRGSEKLNPGIKIHLLQQMLHIWHINPKRRHERKEKFDRIACAFGVGSAYQFLKEGTMRNQEDQEPKIDTAFKLDTDPDIHIDIDINNSEPGLSGILTTYECRQENISRGGMMIISSDQQIAKLKIGQMVITESLIDETAQTLKIGVVRRISNKNLNTIEFGVQFIPGKLLAATVLPEIFGRKHAAALQPCIVLELGENRPKALITPNLTYHADRHYLLETNGSNTNRIIAGKLLESTACFDCFEYNVLKHS